MSGNEAADAPSPAPPVHRELYRYEPFTASNTAALKSGARSERFYEPLAVAIANELMRRHERLTNPLYRESVINYCRVLAKIELTEKYLAEKGLTDAHGDVSSTALFWTKLQSLANKQAAQLGLSPLANARLGRDTAAAQVDLASIIAAAKSSQSSPSTIDGEVESEGES